MGVIQHVKANNIVSKKATNAFSGISLAKNVTRPLMKNGIVCDDVDCTLYAHEMITQGKVSAPPVVALFCREFAQLKQQGYTHAQLKQYLKEHIIPDSQVAAV